MGTSCSQLIKKATNEWSPHIDTEAVKHVIHYIRNHPNSSKRCLSSMTKRLLHKDKNPLVVDKALYLLDACAVNCGYWFRELVASKAVLIPLENLIFNGNPSNSKNAILMVDRWSRSIFANDTRLKPVVDFDAYLKRTVDPRIYIPATATAPTRAAGNVGNTRIRVTSSEKREKFDIDRAIALSLAEQAASAKKEAEEEASQVREKPGPPLMNANPSSCSNSNGRKVVALFDFNALTDNGELSYTVFAGDVLELEDESDPNWWRGCKGGKLGNFPSRFVSKDVTLMFAMKKKGSSNLYPELELTKTEGGHKSAVPGGQSIYNQPPEANNRILYPQAELAKPQQQNYMPEAPAGQSGYFQPDKSTPTAPDTKIEAPAEQQTNTQDGTETAVPYQDPGHTPNIYPQLPTDLDNQESSEQQENIDDKNEAQSVKKKTKKKKKEHPEMLN